MLTALALLIVCFAAILATGLAVLLASGLRFRYAADLAIGAFAAGISALAAAAYVLLLLHLYSRPAAILILLLPILYLAWQLYRHRLSGLLPEDCGALAGLTLSRADAAGAILCLVFLTVGVFECLTTPLTAWDAVMTWDKWATEWALRTDMSERKLAHYPQLMPMVSSLLYKITNTAREPLPLTQFTLHAVQPVIGMFLVLAILRLAAILRVAAWPALLLFFGSVTMTAVAKAAIGDLLAATLFLACITLFFGVAGLHISSRRAFAAFFALLFFGAIFVKANNLTILIVPFILFAMLRRGRKEWSRFPPGLVTGLALALFLFSTYVVHQFANIETPVSHLRLDEVNFEPSNFPGSLAAGTAGLYSADSPAIRWWKSAKLFLGDYELPSSAQIPVVALSLVTLAASFFSPRFWPLVVVMLVHAGIWGHYTAYDTRNLASAVPLFGLLLAGGFSVAFERASGPTTARAFLRDALSVAAFGSLLFLGYRVAIRVEQSASLLLTQWKDHVAAMDAPPAGRIQAFFPMESPAYQFIQSLPPLRESKHIMAGYHLYRWFPNGGYPLSTWYMDGLLPGDTVALLSKVIPGRRPYYDRLTQVYHDGQQRIYLVDRAPVRLEPEQLIFGGDNPPRLLKKTPGVDWTAQSSGPSGWIGYAAPREVWKQGDLLTWRVLLSGDLPDSAVTPLMLNDVNSAIDPARSRAVSDTARPAEKLTAYSGLVTFTGAPAGNLLVGIRIQGAGTTVRVKEFRISTHR
jgi:hypothetical protein